MKMTRDDLKDLIKECLVEILADGVGGQLVEAARKPRRMRENTGMRTQQRPLRGSSARLEETVTADGRIPTATLAQAVRETAGGSSVMADILADTAVNTLPTMLGQPGAPQQVQNPMQAAMVDVAPEQMFGAENVDRWAASAFAGTSHGSSMFTPPPPPSTVRKMSDAELDAPVGGPKKTT